MWNSLFLCMFGGKVQNVEEWGRGTYLKAELSIADPAPEPGQCGVDEGEEGEEGQEVDQHCHHSLTCHWGTISSSLYHIGLLTRHKIRKVMVIFNFSRILLQYLFYRKRIRATFVSPKCFHIELLILQCHNTCKNIDFQHLFVEDII